jgi:hypothetical protein
MSETWAGGLDWSAACSTYSLSAELTVILKAPPKPSYVSLSDLRTW